MDYVEASEVPMLLIGTNGDREAQGTSILMHPIKEYLEYMDDGESEIHNFEDMEGSQNPHS